MIAIIMLIVGFLLGLVTTCMVVINDDRLEQAEREIAKLKNANDKLADTCATLSKCEIFGAYETKDEWIEWSLK